MLNCPTCQGTGKIRESEAQTNSPESVYQYLCKHGYEKKEQEYMVILLLNTKNVVIDHIVAHIGTLNASLAHQRDIFREAVRRNSHAIIMAHNHPSGDFRPSDSDITTTESIIAAGDLLDIKLLDHLVISSNGFTSIREAHGYLWN